VIGIINMTMGNLLSVQNAFHKVGVPCREINDAREIHANSAVVLPGVGAFHVAMQNLRERGFVDPLRNLAAEGRVPILGICLGMQLLADESEEHGDHPGLGLIAGRVIRLEERYIQNKVPNVGWCNTDIRKDSRFFTEAAGSRSYYYVHSYHFVPRDDDAVVATTALGPMNVVAAVEAGSVSGVQFHPEKSQNDGLDLLDTWAKKCGLKPDGSQAQVA
jgi:glutamine amidotransferase